MSDAPQENSAFDEGESVYLGMNNRLVFFPLTWGARKRLRAQFQMVFAGGAAAGHPDWEDAVAKILHASAVRGKPDLTMESFEEMLDIRNLSACLQALSIASGMRARTSDAETKEASDSAGPTVSPTGPNSTQPSSAPPDGPSSNAMN